MVQITTQDVKETQAFKDLSPARKNVARNYHNVKHINDGFIKAQKMGFGEWVRVCSPIEYNKQIVFELIAKKNGTK